MPIPLLWLGAACSALTISELADDRCKQQRQRRLYSQPKRLDKLQRDEAAVAMYPSEFFITHQQAEPIVGAVVCCAIAGVLDHTGIWVGDDTIIELAGNGLIKGVSSERFTQQRSGSNIFIACDSSAQPLADPKAAQRAIEQLYQYQPYDVINNNCHQFIWRCYAPKSQGFTTFRTLNERLAHYFDRQIYWDSLVTKPRYREMQHRTF